MPGWIRLKSYIVNPWKRKTISAVTSEHIQLLHNRNLLLVPTSLPKQLCLSVWNPEFNLGLHIQKIDTVPVLKYSSTNGARTIQVTLLSVQKQSNGHNGGLCAAAFATKILNVKLLIETVSDIDQMRDHLVYCLECRFLTPFPKM